MLNAKVYEVIAQVQGIEYALCDAERRIYEVSTHLQEWIGAQAIGLLVEELFEELTGVEEELELIRLGQKPALTVEKIYRPNVNGRHGYFTLTLCPLDNDLLLIVTNVTNEGNLEQRLTQQRNDLRLLTQELMTVRAQLNDLLHRFVPEAVARDLIANPHNARPGGVRQEITILFADLRGFTSWAEKVSPELVLDLLNEKLAVAVAAIVDAGGLLDKFVGDAVMGLFNTPQPDPDHAWHAVQAGWHFMKALEGSGTLRFSVGVHTGTAVVGNIGTPTVMNFTAIGDAVNQAKRLQEMATGGQMFISGDVYRLVQDRVRVERVGDVLLRGRSHTTEIYELIGIDQP